MFCVFKYLLKVSFTEDKCTKCSKYWSPRYIGNNIGNKQFVLIATDSEGIPDFNLYSTFGEAEKAYFELYNNNIEGIYVSYQYYSYKKYGKSIDLCFAIYPFMGLENWKKIMQKNFHKIFHYLPIYVIIYVDNYAVKDYEIHF